MLFDTDKGDAIARQLTVEDEDGWIYETRDMGGRVTIEVYDEDREWVGRFGDDVLGVQLEATP